MSDPIIQAKNLWKKYLIGEYEPYLTLRDILARGMRLPFQYMKFRKNRFRSKKKREYIWALKDISFDIRQGEVIGIIGNNGAGKSTLLKILSRITRPTLGSAQITGSVGSLLEVGTGFHPELTGRENIYLNGAILGMKKREIIEKFDDIVTFSELEKFIDTPVKYYSSGMYVRLAFSVAAYLEPEILLVDEILSVGDAAFQKKCLDKMDGISSGGRTIIFVSHNMHAIKKLCQKVLLLDNGQIIERGESSMVTNHYISKVSTSLLSQTWEDENTAPGNEWIRLHKAQIHPEDLSGDLISVSKAFVIEFFYINLKLGTKLNLSLFINNTENVTVFNTTTIFEPNWHTKQFPKGLFKSICHVPENLLNVGYYYLDLMFIKDTTTCVFRFNNILSFEVIEDPKLRPGQWYGKYPGVVRPLLNWETDFLKE